MDKSKRIVLVGESNPYGGDPYYALYPAPDGCPGHRLCYKILGMQCRDYIREFERVNLVVGKWSMPVARAAAVELLKGGGRFVLFGSKVASAFGVPFAPFTIFDEVLLVLPHPSGHNRTWAQEGIIARCREVFAAFVPEVESMLGVTDGHD
jgi:hypothetical protein